MESSPVTSILIISDLHLNTKDSRNDFKIPDELFYLYLLQAIKSYTYVILNGDIFDCWECLPPSASRAPYPYGKTKHEKTRSLLRLQKDKFNEICKCYPKTASVIIGVKQSPVKSGGDELEDGMLTMAAPPPYVSNLIYISGNHDRVCRTLNLVQGAAPFWEYQLAPGFRIYVAHGHQADLYNSEHGLCHGNIGFCCAATTGLLEYSLIQILTGEWRN